jgi:hypothetical protein
MGKDFLYITVCDTGVECDGCVMDIDDECTDDSSTDGMTFDEFEAQARESLQVVVRSIQELFTYEACKMEFRGDALMVEGSKEALARIGDHLDATFQDLFVILSSFELETACIQTDSQWN